MNVFWFLISSNSLWALLLYYLFASSLDYSNKLSLFFFFVGLQNESITRKERRDDLHKNQAKTERRGLFNGESK